MIIAVDTETTGLSVWKGCRPYAVGIAFETGETKYIQWKVDVESRQPKIEFNVEFGNLAVLLANENIDKIFHNAKFDIAMLESIGLKVRGKIHDTFIMAKVCNSVEESYGLKELSRKYLNIGVDDLTALKKAVISARNIAKKKGWNISETTEADYWILNQLDPANKLCEIYCKLDVTRTIQLYKFYKDAMLQLGTAGTYTREMQLMPVVMKMERRGVRLHDENITTTCLSCEAEMRQLKQEILTEANDQTLNINSPKQLIKLFFEKMGIPILKRTETGQPSVALDALAAYGEQYPIINKLLRFRGLEKGLGYFNDYLSNRIIDDIRNPEDLIKNFYYKICASFNQMGALTGRFSCNSPNLQNVANPETSAGKDVVNARVAFRPRNGYVWFCFDYSQLEARIFACRANEEAMLQAFRDGRDLHDECGKAAFGDTMEPGQRRKLAKNIFFCKIFGGGPNVLADKYKVSYQKAKLILENYDKTFPTIKRHIYKLSNQAKQAGYIENAFGRKIFIKSDSAYAACNYDVQSSAADLMKNGMVGISEYLEKNPQFDSHLILTIHDELIIEANKKKATKQMLIDLKNIMENHGGAFQLSMPTKCEIVTECWAKKDKVEI